MHELRNFKPDLFNEEQYVFEELVTKEITPDEEEEKEMKKKENQQRLRMDNGRFVRFCRIRDDLKGQIAIETRKPEMT